MAADQSFGRRILDGVSVRRDGGHGLEEFWHQRRWRFRQPAIFALMAIAGYEQPQGRVILLPFAKSEITIGNALFVFFGGDFTKTVQAEDLEYKLPAVRP